MGRVSIPRKRQRASEPLFPSSAYTAGFLAFISTVYVLLNRQPVVAVLLVGSLWALGLLLRPLLAEGKWLIALEYFIYLRAYERREDASVRVEEGEVQAPVAEEVELSDSEREQFAKLMNDAGFDSNWPRG